MEIGEKSKVGLSPDSHNAWEPAQDAGFHIPPATAAAGTMKVNTAEPLESRGCSDSCTEPFLEYIFGGTHTFKLLSITAHHLTLKMLTAETERPDQCRVFTKNNP